jgi:hypothetical protein
LFSFRNSWRMLLLLLFFNWWFCLYMKISRILSLFLRLFSWRLWHILSNLLLYSNFLFHFCCKFCSILFN